MEQNAGIQRCTEEIRSLRHHFSTLNMDGDSRWSAAETRTLLPSGQVPLWIEYDERLGIEEVLERVREEHSDQQQSLNVMGSDGNRVNYFR